MSKFDKAKRCLKGSALTLCIVTGVVSGIALGIILRNSRAEKWKPREVMYFKLLGDLFLRTLKALILPLIVASLVSAIGSLDLSVSGKIGSRALLYYMVTTACAVTQGIILVLLIGPGRGANLQAGDQCVAQNVSTTDTLLDLVRNMFPPNLVQATMQGTQTHMVDPKNDTIAMEDWKIEFRFVDGMNLMGLVVFATVLGITLGKLGPKGKPLLDFFASLSEAMMVITSKVVWFSPIAICSLVCSQLLEISNVSGVFSNLGWYFGTVLTGLMIHGFVVVPTIFWVVTRRMPFRFIANMTQAIATAFGTASSSATLPVTISCLEDKNHVDQHVSRFVLPIGATINMDGTALYLPVGAIYIAQLCEMSLSLGDVIAISLISTTTSIGAAGIPQIGMVIMLTVLNSVGLPGEFIAYIMPVDWLLERFRTAVNIMGDSFGAGLVHHISADELARLTRKNNPLEKYEEEAEKENDVNFIESKI